MRNHAAATTLFLGLAAGSPAQDHAKCPMAASHAAHESDRRDDVDHRHDEATGVRHESSVHHFELAKDGGSIRLEVKDAEDIAGRDRIREHLQVIARAFAAGDFALPASIHGRVPPGADAMKKRKSAISYRFEPTAAGGLVRITTRDAAALDAVHRFLRFQVRDHRTGDPTE